MVLMAGIEFNKDGLTSKSSAHLLGIDLTLARRVRQTNCCVNIIHRSAELTDVVSVNSIWHLTES